MCARAMSPQAEGAGEIVLEKLRGLAGGEQVLEMAGVREDVELVGGAVRDLLLRARPMEIDLTVAGEGERIAEGPERFARELAERLQGTGVLGEGGGCGVRVHERFGTAAVRWAGGGVDVAARRGERYRRPGALPEVWAAGSEEDLRRRDFTVNAIAVGLGGRERGVVRAVEGAFEDLSAGVLRVLHGESFRDDPTRVLRLGRYAARLGFDVEARTERLAREAVRGGALATVSQARVGAEVRLAAAERDPGAAFAELERLGAIAAIDSRMRLDRTLLRQAAQMLPEDDRADLMALAVLCGGIATGGESEATDRQSEVTGGESELGALLDGWELPAGERARVVEAATGAAELADKLAKSESPSQLWRAVGGAQAEAVAIAGAVAGRRGQERGRLAAGRWLSELRSVRLAITGDDLLGAGVPEGPEVGRRLKVALMARLDGRAVGREAELAAALAAPGAGQ